MNVSAAGDPIEKGDYFDYKIHETLKKCKGAYAGYNEDTKGTGHYKVTDIEDDRVTVSYRWKWKYESDTDPSASDSEVGQIIFSRSTRMYLHGFDLDEAIPGEKAVWFWINPDVERGDSVRILDKSFTVTDMKATVWSDWLPRYAIELTYRGKGERNDAYGQFKTTIVDKYYFDPESGYIIAERYEEPHDGRFEGDYAEFDWVFKFDVTDSSYKRGVNYFAFIGYVFVLPALIGLAGYGVYYPIRWSSRTYTTKKYGNIKVRRIWKYESLPSGSFDETTDYFQPFIEDMIRKALVAWDRVVIATKAGEIIGVAIYHRDAKVGSVFALKTSVTEYLRKYVGTRDFFSERRHKEESGKNKPPGRDIYNIYETHKIFEKEIVKAEPYDRKLIRQMKSEDIPEICKISKKAYKIRGRRWFRTLMSQGDISLVAQVDGRVVGFAFATVAGDNARLHSLTVDPAYRGRGIGKELMRARLNMIYHLDAEVALLEIADWNLPSLRISSTFGFTETGKMYVETTKTKRVKRNIVRR